VKRNLKWLNDLKGEDKHGYSLFSLNSCGWISHEIKAIYGILSESMARINLVNQCMKIDENNWHGSRIQSMEEIY
jgi:hypothetical protein